MKLRTLTEQGIQKFRAYLQCLREGEILDPPTELLTDEKYSAPVPEQIDLEDVKFADKREAAIYLSGRLGTVKMPGTDSNSGLWSWLSLFYFEQLCPADSTGRRFPGEDYRHILSPDFRHYYRHLLAGPYRIFRNHPASARALLSGSISRLGDFTEQIASRLEFVSNPGLIATLDSLYFNGKDERIKSGSTNRKRPGTLRRFVDVIQQFELTYDLYSMTSTDILGLLPKEFGAWKN